MTDPLLIPLYVMDGDTVRNATTLDEWVEHMGSPVRQIRHEVVEGMTVSTVFLGMKDDGGRMFETAVWPDGVAVRVVRRYRTRVDAVAGHYQTVAAIQKGQDPGA